MPTAKGDWSLIFYFSTVQSILFRFGLNASLNFVLPKFGNQFYKPESHFKLEKLDMDEDKLPWHNRLKQTQDYDIFNIHCQWNASAVR